jgi:TolB-like protein/tetratricopeptide (TPR) repeat protein
VLASEQFVGMERSSTLLRFLVRQALGGHGSRLKEYTIATEALGRSESFDPRTDPIVRAEVSRLRGRLQQFYATEGKADPLIIQLPRGSYVPQFHNQAHSKGNLAGLSIPLRAMAGRSMWFALGTSLAACLFMLILFVSWRAPADSTISLAVLPFTNLSDDAGQEFFSDGLTDEIVTALGRIPNLRVVARGSASQFKGQRRDLRAVGKALGATHLIEGSVRRDGTRVRIAARLVKADDGVNAWVNSYDREFTDVFAIQEEIATSIAGALSMPLGLEPGERLVANRNIDPQSYEQFLRGKAALLGGRPAFARQIATLEPVVERNPGYAPAWAALARAYRFASSFRRFSAPEEDARMRAIFEAKAVAAARRAIELDPNLVEAQTAYAVAQLAARRWALAEDLFLRTLALDPNNPNVLDAYSNVLYGVGRIKEAVAIKQKVHEFEPFIPIFTGNLAQALWLDGQTDGAITLFKQNMFRQGGGNSPFELARIYASLGQYEEAADFLSMPAPQVPQQAQDLAPLAVQLLRSAPAQPASAEGLPRLRDASFIYLYIGAPERALQPYEEGGRSASDIAILWHPTYAAVRKTERFKKIMRDVGLVDYWRERGWPAFCGPVGSDDFKCD